jgi:hypothetical protein
MNPIMESTRVDGDGLNLNLLLYSKPNENKKVSFFLQFELV